MRFTLLCLCSFLFAQNMQAQDSKGNALFWTAQDWSCDFLEVKIYDEDSVIIDNGKLNKKHTDYLMPECGSENVLNFQALPCASYFFVADCTKEACYVCDGEGSYFQSTVQSEVNRKNQQKNKGQIDGVYKTCHICEGDGEAFQILWIDTFTVQSNKCRTILLK